VINISDESIHTIYKYVVIAELTYAASAWWEFTTAADRQRLQAIIRAASAQDSVPATSVLWLS